MKMGNIDIGDINLYVEEFAKALSDTTVIKHFVTEFRYDKIKPEKVTSVV